MADYAVVVPWRETPARRPAFRYVAEWWEVHAPGVQILTVDTDHQPYNLAAARNAGVRMAQTAGFETVVLSDADAVLADPGQLAQALRWAAGGDLVLPFTEQRYLDRNETTLLLALDTPPSTVGGHGNGAMYVIRCAAYWRYGGSDERFRGWGGEDDGLVAAATALGSVVRVSGTIWSLHHDDERRPVGAPEHRPNAELADRCWRAAGDAAAMRRILQEGGRH